jgi:hypothetical protein
MGPISRRKIPTRLYSRQYSMSGRHLSKIENLYLRTDFRQMPIHTGSIRNNVLHDLALIKMNVARYVGTGSFLIRYTEIRN